MANAAAAPDTGDDADAGASADASDTGGSDEKKLCTIMFSPSSGEFRLIEGDEDEGDEDEGSEAGASGEDASGAGAEGSDADAGEGEGDEQGTTYDSAGALLKGVLDLVKQAQSSASGAGSPEEQMQAGYNGDDSGGAGGSSASMAQKY